jgi:hypothetical protein
MKLIIYFFLLFSAVAALSEPYSLDLESLETPQQFCGLKLNNALKFYCNAETRNLIKKILEDSKKGNF